MRHSGSNLAVHVGGSSLGCFTQFTLNQAREKFDVTCGGDGNKVYVIGKQDFQATGTMVFDDTNTAVWTSADATIPLTYTFYPNLIDIPGFHWDGPFYLDASIDVPVNGAITSAVNLAAAGTIVLTT